jgi:hypothetical protein
MSDVVDWVLLQVSEKMMIAAHFSNPYIKMSFIDTC